MYKKDLDSWEKFEEEIEKIETKYQEGRNQKGGDQSDLLYRGQADAIWKLEATLTRVRKDDFSAYDYFTRILKLKDEIEAYLGEKWELPKPNDFGTYIRDEVSSDRDNRWPFEILSTGKLGYKALGQILKHLNSSIKTSDTDKILKYIVNILLNIKRLEDWEFYKYLVFLRHYGFPSPLLDWTQSPYIAAFFAFQRPHDCEKVAIFIFQEYLGEGKCYEHDKPHIIGLGPKVKADPRHFRQQCQYTICTYLLENEWFFGKHEDAFSQSTSLEGCQDVLHKFTLPASERGKVIKKLESMNINAYTLFSTTDSFIEHLATREFAEF
jgi:hypothetical protein